MTDDLIIIKKSVVKEKLGRLLVKMFEFYTKFNLEIILFWRRLLPESTKQISMIDAIIGEESFFEWFSNSIRTLLNNPITALSISVFTMYIVGGFFQGRISEVLMWLSFFNILTMMLHVLGLINKKQDT